MNISPLIIIYDAAVCFFFLFSGLIQNLSQAAQSRLPLALAESTRRSYSSMFRVFMAFTVFCHVKMSQVNVEVLLAFLECLVVNNVKHSQFLNYLSTLKTCSIADI